MTYLELLKLALLDCLNPVTYRAVSQGDGTVVVEPCSRADRDDGRDWPFCATTMIGMQRLSNIEHLIMRALRSKVPGDYVETGVWRGGAAIFARACLDTLGGDERLVFACDSFEGLPRPDAEHYPADAGDLHHTVDFLAVSKEEVAQNIERFRGGLGGVVFVEGWFRETLPTLTDQTFSVARLDGDMYESTIIALDSLYPRISPGGFVIIDDYGAVEGCREATDEFRARHGIDAQLVEIDWTGAYWQVPERG